MERIAQKKEVVTSILKRHKTENYDDKEFLYSRFRRFYAGVLFLQDRKAVRTSGVEPAGPDRGLYGYDRYGIRGEYPWESLYADEALKDLIRKALDNNKDMKIAAAKVKEMIAAKRISFASMLPEVGANIYAQRNA